MTEQRLAAILALLFGVGLVLVAIGLGVETKAASFAVGFILCVASISLLKGGRP